MTTPEEALEQARSGAASMRAQGGYGEAADALRLEPQPVTSQKLLRWAMIEPDVDAVRSTRRVGAPITGVKRLMLRLLVQYHAELLAQQTRFNLGILSELTRLGERIDELEQRLPPR